MVEKGRKLMEESKFDEAITIWTNILQNDEFNLEAIFLYAVCLRKTKQIGDSIKQFDRAINLSPDNASFYSERGVTYFMQNN